LIQVFFGILGWVTVLATFMGQGKSTYIFSAERLQISAFRSPARWLYPLKPGGERKAEDVWWKIYTLIFLDPTFMKKFGRFFPISGHPVRLEQDAKAMINY
jgi:hypothetical protein